jgi:hypothetical protein
VVIKLSRICCHRRNNRTRFSHSLRGPQTHLEPSRNHLTSSSAERWLCVRADRNGRAPSCIRAGN